jgi:hypothetical protein
VSHESAMRQSTMLRWPQHLKWVSLRNSKFLWCLVPECRSMHIVAMSHPIEQELWLLADGLSVINDVCRGLKDILEFCI